MGYRKLLFLLPVLALLTSCDRDPKAAARRYVSNGNKYFENKKYKEASIMYRKALQKDMRYGEAWYRLGLTNLATGQLGEARRDFSRTTELEPNNLDALIKLADINLAAFLSDPKAQNSALPDLKDEIETLHKKDPNNFDYYRLSGYVAATNRDYPNAITDFEKANRLKPDQPAVLHTLVQVLLASKESDRAEKYAAELMSKHKTFAPIYSTMYTHYIAENRPEKAEDILKEAVANNPTDGRYRVQLAAFYYLSKDKDRAASTLKPLTSDVKTFPNGHLLAGDLYLQLRDYGAAQNEYESGKREVPKDKRIYDKRLVGVLDAEGKADDAAKLLAALLKEDPKDPETISMHAAMLLKTGDRSKSKEIISELQPLAVKFPNSPVIHFNLARAYMESGDRQNVEQARMHFEETLKVWPYHVPTKIGLAEIALTRGDGAKAIQLADDALAVDRSNASALLIRAVALATIGEHEKSRDLLGNILKTWPQFTNAKYQLAVLDASDKRYAEAEQLFIDLNNAGDTRGMLGLVETKVAQNNFNEAINLVNQELRKNPGNEQFRTALANIDFRAGKYSEAATEYQKLATAHPQDWQLYVKLGEAKRQAGDMNGAIDAYNTAHKLAGNQAEPLLQLAMLYDDTGRTDQARQGYEQVLKVQPDNFVALNNLAYEKADNGVDLDQALAYAQRAQQKQPNNLNVMDTVALIYIRKNLTDDGLRVLKDLVNRAPDQPSFHLHLALAYYAKGDRAAAKQELAAAMRNKPGNRDQARIKELMAKLG